MVAFSRGVMGLPKLLLIDEPSLGLAPNIVDNIFDISRQIASESGIAIILKPVGYLCSRASQGGVPTIYELLPKDRKIGRASCRERV